MSEPTESPSTRLPSAPFDLEAFLGGRGLQAVGLISLFLSATFFFKLAVDHGWISPLIRVIIGLAAGSGFVTTGIALQRRAGNRAVIEGLIALGGALWYLSLWAADAMFGLVPAEVALGGMIVATFLLTALALQHRSQITALYGVIGGLLTPALLPHAGGQLALAVYLLALCGGMLTLAQDARFRLVAPVAFLGSLCHAQQFALHALSGWNHVDNVVLGSLFFLEFAAGTIIASRRRGRPDAIDLTFAGFNVIVYLLVLELDLIAYDLQRAAALTVICGVLAIAAYVRRADRDLTSVYLWGSAAAALLTVPAYFAGHVLLECAACAVEGAIVYALAARHLRIDFAIAGLILTAIAVPDGVLRACFESLDGVSFAERALTFGLITAALFGLAVAARAKRDFLPAIAKEMPLDEIAVAVANVVAFTGIANVIYLAPDSFGLSNSMQELLTSVGWTVYAAALFAAGMRRSSRTLRLQSLVLFGATIVKVMIYDLSSIDLIYRVGICLGLGAATLIVSTVYLRRTSRAAQAAAIEADQ